MDDRWWETGGSPPMKPQEQPRYSLLIDPELGLKIKIVLSIIFIIFAFIYFGVSGATIGFLMAVFLTKASSKIQRW